MGGETPLKMFKNYRISEGVGEAILGGIGWEAFFFSPFIEAVNRLGKQPSKMEKAGGGPRLLWRPTLKRKECGGKGGVLCSILSS